MIRVMQKKALCSSFAKDQGQSFEAIFLLSTAAFPWLLMVVNHKQYTGDSKRYKEGRVLQSRFCKLILFRDGLLEKRRLQMLYQTCGKEGQQALCIFTYRKGLCPVGSEKACSKRMKCILIDSFKVHWSNRETCG